MFKKTSIENADSLARPPRATQTLPPLTDLQANDMRKVKQHMPRAIALFRRCYAGVSKAAAIKAMCISCVNLEPSRIADCGIEGCPLWRFRPYQHKSRAGKVGCV